MSKKRFILNDGTKVNSYGFRVRNSGIDLSRFMDNPVMLDEHWNSTRAVLGKWNDTQSTDTQLTAEAEFDEGDENAKSIMGKVDRGYIKGASIGVLYNQADIKMQADGVIELERCELMEASICAIPSNANAIRLYDAQTKALMTEEQVKLSLSAINQPIQKLNFQQMKKVLLAQATLVALSLLDVNTAEGVDASLVDNAVAKMKSDLETATTTVANQKTALDTANAALKALQDKESEAKEEEAKKEVATAVLAGKIDATATESWLQLLLSNPELGKATLAAIPGKKSLAGTVSNPAPGAPASMTEEEFQKLSVEAQLEFKQNNPEAYQKMFA